jgi:hypothetical protein
MQGFDIMIVAFGIALQFCFPKFCSSFGNYGVPARGTRVVMPKAAVHKYDGFSRFEYKIGFAGQIPSMESVTVSQRMDKAPHNHLRLGILAADTGHVGATLFYG